MKGYLEKKRGQMVRIIIELNAQKQPTHYYEGMIVTVGEVILLRETHLGDVAINPEKITAVQILNDVPVQTPEPNIG